ncbi:hypothetical protein [Chlorobium ferrooxidans]|nr:hypothetical protein [Chlorobium ferrooxidans]
MESLGLTEFLKTVGRAVHSMNTICVGLHGVGTGKYEKPDDLTISWNTKDPCASSRTARQFAVESALVFIEEALLQYLKYVLNHPAAPSSMKAAMQEEKAADKVDKLSKQIQLKEVYWAPIVILLIHWRNRIVHHSSKAKLSDNQEKILIDNQDKIRSNHANIDISETLAHFSERKITLKDASTIIAITIRFVRDIDEFLQLYIVTPNNIRYFIEYLDIVDEYKEQLKANGIEVKSRKIKQLFKTYLPFVSEDFVVQVIEKPIEFNDK